MGLDAVEIVLRVEELFAITLPDAEIGSVRTVGEFYKLICSKLSVTPLPNPATSAELPIITHKEKQLWILAKHTPLPAPPELLPWTPQGVWDALVAVFVDQQHLDRKDILPTARIAHDLGVS